jgi:galactokinase
LSARAALNVAYAAVVEHATAEQRADIDAALSMPLEQHAENRSADVLAHVLAAGGEVG